MNMLNEVLKLFIDFRDYDRNKKHKTNKGNKQYTPLPDRHNSSKKGLYYNFQADKDKLERFNKFVGERKRLVDKLVNVITLYLDGDYDRLSVIAREDSDSLFYIKKMRYLFKQQELEQVYKDLENERNDTPCQTIEQ